MPKFKEQRNGHHIVSKPIVVLYHGDCSDGFGGAWAAWKKFGAKAEYIPLYRGKPIPKGLKGKEIYMIDFMYSVEETRKLIRDNIRVTGIDHHITSKDAVVLTHKPLFALDHSGAVLAWNYFHPTKKIPWLLRHVEDRDLWKWKIPYTREIITFINLYDFDFKLWNEIARDLEKEDIRKGYIEKGATVEVYRANLIMQFAKNAEEVLFDGYRVLSANAPHQFASDLGSMLGKQKGSFGIVWSKEGQLMRVSLRSGGAVDVATIAQKFGGGGHRAAAGFVFSAQKKFPWKSITQ